MDLLMSSTVKKASRIFWWTSVLCCVLAIICKPALSITPENPQPAEHRLRMFHTHTGERIDIVYRRGNDYVADALAQLDFFLRDHRTGDVHHFDPRLYDVLEQLTASVGRLGAEIDVICGYRTPWSNNFLRTHSPGVAEHSLHMQAEAIDIRMPGINSERLREAALHLHEGGVGYYPHSNFVHVDVGRVRQWCFGCSVEQMHAD
jgi:uncharacterized protein YcbK (DUF882 family)